MSRRGTLARRIAQATMASALVTALVTGLVYIPLISSAAESSGRESLGRYADITAESINGIMSAPKSGLSEHDRHELEEHAALPRLLDIFRLEGISAQRLNSQVAPNPPVRTDDVAQVLAGEELSIRRTVDGEAYFIEGRQLADGTALFLDQATGRTHGIIGDVFSRFGIALVFGMLAALLLGLWVARKLSRPLTSAAEAAHRLSSGERDVVVEPTGPAEVAEIAEGLNRLSGALTVSEGRQREFLLTVSHELRTPLTSVKGYSEALADGMIPPEDVERIAALVKGEADRLDRLVADLLDLARLGAVDVAIAPAEIDLANLCRVAAEVWQDRCAREGIVFSLEVPSTPVFAFADALRVRQIIDNLCENALRVTPQGRPLVLATWQDGDNGVIEVRDGGPGLTPDDLAVAFEPAELWTRYKGVRKVGSGVGLALVAKLAERMGGIAAAGGAAEGGARFTVRLPATSDSPALQVTT